jgi:RNA polymerase sigma factor (sigma-70 family)
MLQTTGRLRTPPPRPPTQLAALAAAAVAGDELALDRLVDRFDVVLRRIARSYRLDPWDVDDVVQATWLQFFRHVRSLREPAAVGGWLATTARRESLRLLHRRARERLTEDAGEHAPCLRAGPDAELLDAERRELVRGALAALPDRPRRLMRVLVTQPELSYEDVAELVGMPIGSIGPTRARALQRLGQRPELRALRAACA